ncbi:IS4 family transposase [Thermaurantimonas aggregans]|uniref:IS4 family transposase n=1 Tax=Thermaurantimonas aggregans TaxID=2173829 RepID=UPI0023F4D991|nr:IS4 family transposase [Thermaurantimonas aggregans]MCX8149862.1 IS4 family transposase [Thermaurantimonas aggregans]
MNKVSTILKSLASEISRYEFQNEVDFFNGDKRTRRLKTWQLFLGLIFGQVMNSYSLREIQHSLEANRHRLYHNGLSLIKRSTLAEALQKRDYRIFMRVYEKLLGKALMLASVKKQRFKNPLRIIDSTSLEVNVNRFPWAKFRQTKGGLKLHMSYDPETALAYEVLDSEGKVHDSNRFRTLTHQAGITYVADRAYCDFNSLYSIEINGGYFVTRAKKNIRLETREVLSVNATGPVRKDSKVVLIGPQTKKQYPQALRLVEYYAEEQERTLFFLTNDFRHSGQEIADMYKERWEIELFFKWLKQNLKLKTFWGTSKNAVLMQIWIALILYLLLWIMKVKNMIDFSLQRIRQILKTTLLEKRPLELLFRPPPPFQKPVSEPYLFEGLL